MRPRVVAHAVLLRERSGDILRLWIVRLRSAPAIPRSLWSSRDGELERLHSEAARAASSSALAQIARSQARRAEPAAGDRQLGGRRGARLAPHRRGYTLAEELRELGVLRSVIVDLCAREGVVLDGKEAQLVHSALDEVMITAAVEMRAGELGRSPP